MTVNGQTLVRNTDYKVTTESGRFHIIFAPTTNDQTTASDIVAMKAKFPVGAAVVVKYDMTVNRNAVAGKADTNTNNVEYSRNPNTVTDHATTPGQTDRVYTGRFTLTKHDTNNAPLAGAEFKVYEGDQTTTPVRFVKSSDGLTYRKADLTESTGTTDTVTSVSGNNGVVTLTGLDGKYTVKETKSPVRRRIHPAAVHPDHQGQPVERLLLHQPVRPGPQQAGLPERRRRRDRRQRPQHHGHAEDRRGLADHVRRDGRAAGRRGRAAAVPQGLRARRSPEHRSGDRLKRSAWRVGNRNIDTPFLLLQTNRGRSCGQACGTGPEGRTGAPSRGSSASSWPP